MLKKIDGHVIFLFTACDECYQLNKTCDKFFDAGHDQGLLILIDNWKRAWIPTEDIIAEKNDTTFVDDLNGISWTRIEEIPNDMGNLRRLLDCVRSSFFKDDQKNHLYGQDQIMVIRPEMVKL